jgi:uncharacterized NAD(P)/FAD-binding protein YdhS
VLLDLGAEGGVPQTVKVNNNDLHLEAKVKRQHRRKLRLLRRNRFQYHNRPIIKMIRLARGEAIEKGEGGETGAMRLHEDRVKMLDRKAKKYGRL